MRFQCPEVMCSWMFKDYTYLQGHLKHKHKDLVGSGNLSDSMELNPESQEDNENSDEQTNGETNSNNKTVGKQHENARTLKRRRTRIRCDFCSATFDTSEGLSKHEFAHEVYVVENETTQKTMIMMLLI